MLETIPETIYTMGYNLAYVRAQERFAQQPSLNFLVPHLLAGRRLLDVGCGAGFLSARLAEAVVPGEMVGIDFEQSQVVMARETAAQRKLGNARFQLADALDLPFADDSFDVVHIGGVLMHVADADLALAEARRVLKPGGLVACRDLMLNSCFAHPELGMMKRSFEMLADTVAADGGQPDIARDIKMRLKQAGFTDIRVAHSFETYDAPEDLNFFHAIVKQWFLSDIVKTALDYGAATEDMKLIIARCLDEWRRDPGALAGIAFSQALAVHL